eukprot:Sdes_comp20138_c0_seq2m13238
MSFQGGASMPGGASAAEGKQEAEAVEVQTEFTVKLNSVDSTQRVKAIREVKSILPELNLVQAKKFVENLPAIVKENISKEQAEEIVKALTAAGGSCVIE